MSKYRKVISFLLILQLWFLFGLLGSYIAIEHIKFDLAMKYPDFCNGEWEKADYYIAFGMAFFGPLNFISGTLYALTA